MTIIIHLISPCCYWWFDFVVLMAKNGLFKVVSVGI